MGRTVCFTRYGNGIAASFQACELRYLILSTDQLGYPRLSKHDASALVALYGQRPGSRHLLSVWRNRFGARSC